MPVIKTVALRLNSPECLALLGPVIHMASNTKNNVRVVLRQHAKGFSRTILRNNPRNGENFWDAIEHTEYLSEIVE
jgi:hypothetical protein